MRTSKVATVNARYPRLVVAALAALAVAATTAGCSSSLPSSVAAAPVESVVTGLWPLAVAAQAIGGDKVAVDDVVPAGDNPFTYPLDPARQRTVEAAGLAVEIGRGFQPAFEEAARHAPRTLALEQVLRPASPYVWLSPTMMERAVSAIADAMTSADPPAGPLFERNAAGFRAEIESLRIDYSSTLSVCPGTAVVAPDRALADLAGDLGLTETVVAASASAASVSGAARVLESANATALIRQPWVDDSGVERVGAAAGIRPTEFDTLAGVPAGPVTGSGDPYTQLMENDLNVLSRALGCNNNEQ